MPDPNRLDMAIGALNGIKPDELSPAEVIQYANAVANIEIAKVATGLAPYLAKSSEAKTGLLAKIATAFAVFNDTYEWDYRKRHGESVSDTTSRSREPRDVAKQVDRLL
ncbi:hypothetical protein [Mycobacterium sp. NPDC050853]|uniref:hypothetical protein n=1 Tax=Mycobacterium sp. NPDC050853 TaxID=3155160 RepID=UPI00340F19AB